MTVAVAPQGQKRPFILRRGIANANDLEKLPVSITASTVTLSPTTHAGRVVSLNRAAGIAVTLPAATGSGDNYLIFVGTTFTGASSIACAGSDIFVGTAVLFADSGATVVGFNTTATSDTIDLLGTSNSTGGLAGETIDLVDVASGVWMVRLVSDAGGTEATPFNAP